MVKRFLLICAILVVAESAAVAQPAIPLKHMLPVRLEPKGVGIVDQPDSLYQQFAARFKKSYFSIGALIQTRFDFQSENSQAMNNGFEISRLRFRLSGEMDRGHGYFIQANFLRSPAILDAKIYHRISNALTIDFGMFKAPFSREFLTGSANLNFIKRAQAVDALVPGRQIGLHARGWIKENVLSYAAGVFNGNDIGENENDNDNFLYAMRLVYSGKQIIHIASTSREENLSKFEFGISAAYSKDKDVTIGNGLVSGFAGKRLLLGGDFSSTHDKLVLSAEAIYAKLDPSSGDTSHPFGFYLTAGYKLSQTSQILIRCDGFDADDLQLDSDLIVLGYNYWSTRVTKFQINYTIPTGDHVIKGSKILLQTQLGF